MTLMLAGQSTQQWDANPGSLQMPALKASTLPLSHTGRLIEFSEIVCVVRDECEHAVKYSMVTLAADVPLPGAEHKKKFRKKFSKPRIGTYKCLIYFELH